MFYHKQTDSILLDLQPIILQSIARTIDELVSLELIKFEDIKLDFSNVDQRNILYHNVIHLMCENLIECKHAGYKIYHFRGSLNVDLSQQFGFEVDYDGDKLTKTIQKALNGILKHLPILIYQHPVSFKELVRLLENGQSGESIAHLVQITELINTFDRTIYTFGRLKNYTKRYRLNFLSEDYFNQFRTKKLWYSR